MLPELTCRQGGFILCRMAIVLGIDPGISGALALVERDGRGTLKVLRIEPLPLWSEQTKTGKTRRYLDLPPLLELLASMEADCIVCERMIAAPGISGSTAFSMGATMGVLQAALRAHGARHKLVVSSVWKRALDCPPDKEAARLFAGRLFGSDDFWPLKKDHNKAEAALIAAWGSMTL